MASNSVLWSHCWLVRSAMVRWSLGCMSGEGCTSVRECTSTWGEAMLKAMLSSGWPGRDALGSEVTLGVGTPFAGDEVLERGRNGVAQVAADGNGIAAIERNLLLEDGVEVFVVPPEEVGETGRKHGFGGGGLEREGELGAIR